MLACALMLLAVGCAPVSGRVGAGTAARDQARTPAADQRTAAPAAVQIRDFSLRVKCPGIHLTRTEFKWSDARVMSYYGVSKAQIARCEAWEAAQPKGYVPPRSPAATLDADNSARRSRPATGANL